jgi:hypothetical protein
VSIPVVALVLVLASYITWRSRATVMEARVGALRT